MGMRSRLRLDARKGISTYMEVFILVAAVLGLSGAVYAVATQYATSTQGASLTITNAVIRQGTSIAVEGLTVANTGTVAFTAITMTTFGISSPATYCLSVLNPETGTTISSSCPAGSNPASVAVVANLLPGQSIVLTVTTQSGSVFAAGDTYSLIVSATPAAQSAAQVVAVSA